MRPTTGDHVCALYSTDLDLAQEAATFLADGLRRRERCWYVASADEEVRVRAALEALHVDVDKDLARGALGLISAPSAYVIHGAFDPEATLRVFNDAIEQACDDGFSGFRAAADMSWALDHEDTQHLLIVYEALLKSLFSTCRATGLCLYDRRRMPLGVINGALETHPLVLKPNGERIANGFYDSTVTGLAPVADSAVLAKLAALNESHES